MRELRKNQTGLWYVNRTGETDETDVDGNFTGEKVPTFSTPVKVRLSLYPSNDFIINRIFGKDYSCDMIASSNSISLNENTLLFLTEPSTDYENSYDYTISRISPSLNSYNYGLCRKI